MPPIPRSILKAYFETGDKPTQAQFFSLIDSSLNMIDDRKYLGLKNYNTTLTYEAGDTTVYNGIIYLAIATTTGAFDPNAWTQIDFDNAIIPITYNELAALKASFILSAGQMYYITDRRIWIQAISKKELSLSGQYLAANPDYQNVNGNNVGIWNPELTGLQSDYSIAIWNNLHWVNLVGSVGGQPDTDPNNWLLQPPPDPYYIMEIDDIKYDFDFDFIFERCDKRGNVVSTIKDPIGMLDSMPIEIFQWGRDGVNGNFVQNALFNNMNALEINFSVEATDFANIKITENANLSNAIVSGLGASVYIRLTSDLQKVIIRNNGVRINAITTNPGKRIEPGFSNFEEMIDITGQTTLDLVNFAHAGILNVKSTNPAETLELWNAAPINHPFELRPVAGLMLTINNGTGGSNEFALPVPSLVLDGDRGDFVKFKYDSGVPVMQYVQSVNYLF